MNRTKSLLRRGRSVSIAVPCEAHVSDGDDDEDDAAAITSPRLLSRRKSDCRYRSTGNVRAWTPTDLEDLSVDSWHCYRLRCFSVSSKGVVSRGDHVKYRRVRSMSIQISQSMTQVSDDASTGADGGGGGGGDRDRKESSSSSSNVLRRSPKTLTVPGLFHQAAAGASSSASAPGNLSQHLDMEEFTVYLIGSPGVGKSTLMHQFTTSEHILNAKGKDGQGSVQSVVISLDFEESKLFFRELATVQSVLDYYDCLKLSAFLVVYSVTDLDSFLTANYILCTLQQHKLHETNSIILVGNKSDLVRSRVVDQENGHTLACNYKIKFIETSVGINYNVDKLLVGVLTNLRLLRDKQLTNLQRTCTSSSLRTWKPFSQARSSIRRWFGWVLGKQSDHHTLQSCDIFS